MRNILIVGAGKSSSFLIKYFIEKSISENLNIQIIDNHEDNLQKHQSSDRFSTYKIDIFNENKREKFIKNSDIVISMLPVKYHILIAKSCLKLKKNLVTASYVSEDMKKLDKEVKKNKLIFLNEIGLDPGIDHMSAKKIIDNLQSKGNVISSFKSYTGGLISNESDNNSWNYKFTWNPRNVILAGQGKPAKYIENNRNKSIAYKNLFENTWNIDFKGFGKFEVYANRDSLKYKEKYGFSNIKTMMRGTIRKPNFCNGWNMFVKLGLTSDDFNISESYGMSYRDFLNYFLPKDKLSNTEEKIKKIFNINEDDHKWDKLNDIEIFSSTKKILIDNGTPAEILEYILKDKWKLKKEDKDMVLMYHEFIFHDQSKSEKKIISQMACLGENRDYTAMAKTVGLPVAFAALLILNNKTNLTGVQTPIHKELYIPILKKLENYGIKFEELY